MNHPDIYLHFSSNKSTKKMICNAHTVSKPFIFLNFNKKTVDTYLISGQQFITSMQFSFLPIFLNGHL